MPRPKRIDRVFQFILRRFKETGQAPHYTELAAELKVSPDKGRKLMHDLIDTGLPAWFHPDTDYIASFPPFNNLPTQYRITVDGEQKWFAQ